MRRHAAAALVGALLAATTAAVPAHAWYSASGTATLHATITTLPAPSITSATAGGGSVALRWSAVTAPSGNVSYVVRRDGGAPAGTCPTAQSPGTATSCTDTGVAIGAHSYTVTAIWRTWTATSDAAGTSVASGPAARLAMTASTTTLTAGDTATLTITALDAQGNVVTSYDGATLLTFGGASTIGSLHPTVTNRVGSAIDFGSGTSIEFTNGVAATSSGANGVLRLYKAQSTSITVSDGTIGNGAGLAVTVSPGPAATATAASGSGQTAYVSTAFASPFAALITDASGNPIAGATVTFTAPATGASGTFANGTRTTTATTNTSGQATSSVFTANATGGSYAVSAGATGTSSTTFATTNQPLTTATALALANGPGGAAGTLNAGDTITVTFAQPLAPATICVGGWSGSGSQNAVGATVTVTSSGTNNDTLTVGNPTGCTTFRFGTIDLGSPNYVTGSGNKSTTFAGSIVAYSATARTLTVTLGTTLGGNGTIGTVATATATFTPVSGIQDVNGQPVATTAVSSTGQQF